ncbi:MAG: S8 family peptidase [Candidatus Doudnabacteria bacterium]
MVTFFGYRKIWMRIIGAINILALVVLFVFYPTDKAFAQKPNHEYLVQLKQTSQAQLILDEFKLKPFVNQNSDEFGQVYSFFSSRELSELQAQLAGKVEYLEPVQDYKVEFTVNDPGFTTNELNIDKQWGLAKADFIKAWDSVTGSREVVVAVIDTGVDATHEDLRRVRFMKGYDFVNDKSITRREDSDDNGHGTLVTGVIAANSNNSQGVAGAAFGVSIMPLKALNARGAGSSKNIAKAIIWATDNGADIINMSLGGLGFAHDSTLSNAISYAFEHGVLLVSAAGNDVAITGGNLDKDPVFPICNDNGQNMVIGVTATDHNDLKPNFANYGKSCVDVSAPGKRILSTINHDPATGTKSPNSYAYASGTSLATPFVSAEAALIKSLFPSSTNTQIRDRIISTSDPIDKLNLSQCGGGSCEGFLGGGRINANQSLQEEFITLKDGDIIKLPNGSLYLINGGKRLLISTFVFSQRYAAVKSIPVNLSDVANIPEGSFAPPLDGTLVKVPSSPEVYLIDKGLRLPISYQVFNLRGFSFNNIKVLPETEVYSWVEGSFLTPPDGTLIRTFDNPTVYWVVGGVLHPINYNFYTGRGLNIFPVIFVGSNDLSGLTIGESFIL